LPPLIMQLKSARIPDRRGLQDLIQQLSSQTRIRSERRNACSGRRPAIRRKPERESHAPNRQPRQRIGFGSDVMVKEQILRRIPDVELAIEVIKTSADRDATTSIRFGPAIGVFVKELEQALMDEQIDLAVHR